MAFPAAYSAWQYRQKFKVKSAMIPGGTLNNQLVLVSEETFGVGHNIWSQAKSDGGDLLITDLSDVRKAISLVRWTPGSEICQLWTELSSLSSSTDTEFYIYWGNASASQPAVVAAFGQYEVYSNADCKLHYAFEGTSTNPTDYTEDGSDGTGVNGVLSQQAGQIDDAFGFDGVDDRVDIPAIGFALGGTGVGEGYSIQMTFKVDSGSSDDQGIYSTRDYEGGANRIGFFIDYFTGGDLTIENNADGGSFNANISRNVWHTMTYRAVNVSGTNTAYLTLDGGSQFSDNTVAWDTVLADRISEIGITHPSSRDFPFEGLVDNFFLFDKDLTEDAARALENNTLTKDNVEVTGSIEENTGGNPVPLVNGGLVNNSLVNGRLIR